MARAGYCSACRNYVFLNADGGCGNGHGAEYVSNHYEVPEPGAPPQPAYQPPQPAYAAAPGAPPKKKRTGLIIAVVIIVFLLLCCCGVTAAALSGAIPNPLGMLASPERQKAQVAGDFVEALLTANLVQMRRTIPAEAANAADPTFWMKKLMEGTPNTKITSKSWTDDTLTMVVEDADGTKREFVVKAGSGDTVEVTTRDAGSTDAGDTLTMAMKKELDGWKVLSLGTGSDELIRFDAASMKKLQEENK
jgi:hypothetical protein